jgi:hypothetical protein
MVLKTICRPPSTLQLLSAVYRWEFTRRHPYYLQHWESAKAYDRGLGCVSSENRLAASSVALLAGALTWSSEYWHPAIDGLRKAAEDPTLDISPCAGPVTVRSLLFRDLITLPRDLRKALAHILLDEGLDGDGIDLGQDDTAKHWRRRRAVEGLDHPLMDEIIRDLVRVNPNAPKRGIQGDMARLLKNRRQGHKEKRRTDASTLDAYLAVWDLREGWAEGGYDAAKEKRLRDISTIEGVALPTVQSRYRSAFTYITGQEYTAETWAILFLPLKASRFASWRKGKPRSEGVIVIPAALLEDGNTNEGGIIAYAPDPQSEVDLQHSDMIMDVRTLVKKGRTDDQICQELECSADLVQWIRERDGDGL